MTTNRRVLIADDNQDAADSTALCLRMSGHETHVAYDGEEAYEKACLLAPHVIFVDLAMPRMNGYELARRIRLESKFNETLLVALTGYADENHRLQSDESGIDVFLVKPADMVELESLVRVQIGEEAAKASESPEMGCPRSERRKVLRIGEYRLNILCRP